MNPLSKSEKRPLSLIDFASALKKITPNSMPFNTVPKLKIDIVWKVITECVRETDFKVTKIESYKTFCNCTIRICVNTLYFTDHLMNLSLTINSSLGITRI